MVCEPAAAPNTNWLQTIRDPDNANLDIVAVHGMNVSGANGHSENTWTERESGTHWLKDLLPEVLPTSAAGIKEQALNLLHCLHSKRNGALETRPIIFIAHSMGGILVKEALAISFHDSQLYSMLWIFTYSIVFFGVPHRGSRHAAWGKMAARMVQLFTGRPNENFLSSVEEGSSYNADLSERFGALIDAFKYFSICETLPDHSHIEIGLIVEMDSATLDLPDSQEVKLYPNRTHKIPPSPYSLQQSVLQGQLVLATSERLFGELRIEDDTLRNGFEGIIAWAFSFLEMLFTYGITLYLSSRLFLPRASTIMENADRARQTQERIIEFGQQAIEKLDSNRRGVLESIIRLQSPLTQGELPPNGLLLELSQQVKQTISEMERLSRAMPEEIRRLRRIEDGQREAQGMDDRQLLEMVGSSWKIGQLFNAKMVLYH
ncbi:hypothetical protein M441DRAFT_24809 [Trichoderma asperellum CBS 433.97]|uniref:DUF676 domain-containing protein n=1 Tax=Trichoderma asperellum (strain ATCC 204424 / CBS 433.97 / NBRC 101777) TaxID=1042311 RepID=A0A2T3ZIP6_TRIA4|nr:hypothetical protein M441DRAFT_24809 [Trichoderma asperellum CBS 433.97]PTB44688.1 hypothetical protein M441DRAFT_24809 [Trichoderma asperellum CBS 433.97]